MKYWRLLRVGLTRKKFRTALTIGSFAVAMLLFGLLVVVRGAFNQGVTVAGADRLVVINRVSLIQPLPYAYRDRMQRIPGIKEITFADWFDGIYIDERHSFFARMAVDTATYRQMYTEFKVPDDQWKAFLDDRQGAIAGTDLIKRFGWKIGDRIPIKGTIFPGAWEFNLRGIYEGARPEDDRTQFWFHYDYLNEGGRAGFMKDMVGWYVVRLQNPDDAPQVVKAIDDMFANSPWETKTDTEQSFAAGFVKQTGNIEFLILSIGAVVFFTLLLVTGNTMAIAVRERTPELAILKALGYSNRFILFYVLAESLSIALIGGLIGLTAAKVLAPSLKALLQGVLSLVYLPVSAMISGTGVALLIGAMAGLIPALTASRLRVVDALRKL